MKVILLILLLTVPSISFDDKSLDQKHTPTRREWLEYSVDKALKFSFGQWAKRYYYIVWARNGVLTVSITPANGQGPAKDPKLMKDMAKNAINDVIEKYKWAKGIKVIIQIL